MERDLIISSQLANLSQVRLFLDQIFVESGLNRGCFNRVLLGLCEAVNNSILHGNGLNPLKNVFIRVRINVPQIIIEVEDEGQGFSFDCLEDPTRRENIRKENGRGIFLIRKLADHVLFENGGRKVIIIFSLHE